MRSRVGWPATGAALLVATALLLAPAWAVAAAPAEVPAEVPAGVPAQSPTSVGVAPASVPGVAVPEASVATSAPAQTVRIGDPAADRTIRRILLALLGLAGTVLVVTAVFWRATKPIPIPLRRLATMGSRSWRKADSAGRAAMLGPVATRPAPVEAVVAAPAAVALAPLEADEVVPEPVAVASEPIVAASEGAPATVVPEPAADAAHPAARDGSNGAAAQPQGPPEASASLLADG